MRAGSYRADEGIVGQFGSHADICGKDFGEAVGKGVVVVEVSTHQRSIEILGEPCSEVHVEHHGQVLCGGGLVEAHERQLAADVTAPHGASHEGRIEQIVFRGIHYRAEIQLRQDGKPFIDAEHVTHVEAQHHGAGIPGQELRVHAYVHSLGGEIKVVQRIVPQVQV